jgi:hypothetical protein
LTRRPRRRGSNGSYEPDIAEVLEFLQILAASETAGHETRAPRPKRVARRDALPRPRASSVERDPTRSSAALLEVWFGLPRPAALALAPRVEEARALLGKQGLGVVPRALRGFCRRREVADLVARSIAWDETVDPAWRAQVARATVLQRAGKRPRRVPPLTLEILLGARKALPPWEFERLSYVVFGHDAPPPQFCRAEGPVEYLRALFERRFPIPEEKLLLALTALATPILIVEAPRATLHAVVEAAQFTKEERRELYRWLAERNFNAPPLPRRPPRLSAGLGLEEGKRTPHPYEEYELGWRSHWFEDPLVVLGYERFVDEGGDLDPLARKHLQWGREMGRWQWRARLLFELLERRPEVTGADRILAAAAVSKDPDLRRRALERITARLGPRIAEATATPQWRTRKPWLRQPFSWGVAKADHPTLFGDEGRSA